MITQQTQIKINLPVQLKDFVESKASRFGIPVASYIKHLIMKDISETDYPIFKASERTEKKALEAIQRRHKAIAVKDVKTFFKNLK